MSKEHADAYILGMQFAYKDVAAFCDGLSKKLDDFEGNGLPIGLVAATRNAGKLAFDSMAQAAREKATNARTQADTYLSGKRQ